MNSYNVVTNMVIGLSHKPRRNARASTSVLGPVEKWARVLDAWTVSGSKQVSSNKTNKTNTCLHANVGTLTGKTEELARALRKRRIDICALQETRWSGVKSCDIERERGKNGYKLLYFGNPNTQYGVGIVISEGFRDAIKKVERLDDRLMKFIIISADRPLFDGMVT